LDDNYYYGWLFYIFLSSRPRLMKNNRVNGLICRFLVFLNVCVLAWFIALGSDAKKTFAQNHCPMPSYASQPTSGLCACYTISANQILYIFNFFLLTCVFIIFFIANVIYSVPLRKLTGTRVQCPRSALLKCNNACSFYFFLISTLNIMLQVCL